MRKSERIIESGFTFIELVIVMLCVTLLAAILVPVATDVVSEAKNARAQSTCQEIAKAIQNFRQDLNNWPRGAGAVSLISGDSINCTTPYGFVEHMIDDGEGGSVPVGITWFHINGDGSCGQPGLDLMKYHLITNTPQGLSGNAYSTTGQYRWRGPYLKETPLDPWGHPYVISWYTDGDYNTTNNLGVIVISAGPNGQLNHRGTIGAITCYENGGSEGVFNGGDVGDNDDIWILIDCLK